MSAPKVLGLDLSLTATGVATPNGTPMLFSAQGDTIEERVASARGYFAMVLSGAASPDVVVIEDLPRNVKFGGPALGLVHGAFCCAWSDSARPPLVRVTPASLKKYATGKGNAGKSELLAAAIRRLGYEGHDDNESDALWLRALVLDALGEPVCDMPALSRHALAKVTLPASLSSSVGAGEGAT